MNDRGSQSDLWASSVSVESSSPLLPRQYLDVSSQTDVSGNVSNLWEALCTWRHSSELCVELPHHEFPSMDRFLRNHFSWFKVQCGFVFVCSVNVSQGQADVSQYCLCQNNPGRNKNEGSLILPVGVASCDTNTPLALYSNSKLQDKEQSAGLCGLSSHEDFSLGCKWEQQLMCRYSDATKVLVFINLQSHTCKEIRSVRLVPALVSQSWGYILFLTGQHRASPVNLYLEIFSQFQSRPHMLVKICRSGYDGMSLVFKTLRPKQDVIQTKMQCST